MENILRHIIEGVSDNHGKRFLETITLKMHQVIGADFTFIARLDIDAYLSRTVALVADGEVAENMEYSLEYTPCANVADNSVCIYPEDITHLFPNDQLLIDMGIEGYIGTPLQDENGEVMGLTVALYKRPIPNPEFVRTVFQIFSGRIAAEISRMEYAASLELKVKERTEHLESALEKLKMTQNQLIHQEKLASLGGVVAGVAHEVNTPLGIAKTGASFQKDLLNRVMESYEKKELKASVLDKFFQDSIEASKTVEQNLERAVDLINNFKLAAVDRIDSNIYEHNLNSFIRHLVTPLNGEFSRNHIDLSMQISPDIVITTLGSELSQVMNNLIMNACVHAYEGVEKPELSISAQVNNEHLEIFVSDNGVGVESAIRSKVFEPFITTKRNQGSTGLGMNIVHNLVTMKLNGQIELLPKETGTTWKLTLPLIFDTQDMVSQKLNQR